MWLDARAKLAEIAGEPAATSATPATQAPAARPVSQMSRLSQPSDAQKQALRVASVAGVAIPLTETARARAAALPTAPPTCAACGVADWHVSLTDAKWRTLHVACWRADERGKR